MLARLFDLDVDASATRIGSYQHACKPTAETGEFCRERAARRIGIECLSQVFELLACAHKHDIFRSGKPGSRGVEV